LIDRDLRERRRPEVLGDARRLQADFAGGDAAAQQRIQLVERTVGVQQRCQSRVLVAFGSGPQLQLTLDDIECIGGNARVKRCVAG
jgi:hypothetical protein